MCRILVATSIAPKDIDNQRKAVDSWIKAGLEVISFNCLEEYEAIKESFQDVDFKIVKRDGRHRFGKPYVYFDDIMEYFSGCDYDICGIINSDIHLLGVDNKFNEYIYEEARDSFVYGNRVEVKSLDDLNGMFYVGHDYFFFDRQVSCIYPREDFWIGQPAWDYWVVYMPIVSGFKVKKIINAIAYHVSHRIQWNEELNLELHRMIVDKYFDKAENLMRYKSVSRYEKFYELIQNYYQPIIYRKNSIDYSILVVYNRNAANKSDEPVNYDCILNQTYKNLRVCYGSKDSIDLDKVEEDLIFFMDEGTSIEDYFFDIMVNSIENRDMCICSFKVTSSEFNYIKDVSPLDLDSYKIKTDIIIDECILYKTKFYKESKPINDNMKDYNFAFVPNGLVKKEFKALVSSKLRALGNAKLYIYGAGGHTKKLLKQIDTGNLNICGIIDSNPELDNTYLNGIRVYGRDRMDELDIDYILISSMSYEKEIFDDLKRTVDIGKLITIYNY
ncbi:MAG: nucleoside-diphosphate sugar epimerase/dehydratase [Lutisporaceae bacterium]|jgi:hypothetical protein